MYRKYARKLNVYYITSGYAPVFKGTEMEQKNSLKPSQDLKKNKPRTTSLCNLHFLGYFVYGSP